MKCKICNSCLEVIRLDFQDQSYIYRYCDVCDKVFELIRRDREITNEEHIKLVRDEYFRKYKGRTK